jgi:ribonucleotide monophosphatase NagD (HAD superfamily)
MVGDDIRSDIGGAKRIGMRTALVKTGKFRNEQLKDADIMPDYLINSVADIPRLLDL